MKRYAIVSGDEVVNVAIADYPLGENWIESDEAGIGWKHKDGKLTPQPEQASTDGGSGGGPVEPPGP